MAKRSKHWGKWVEERSRQVGFSRQRELARAIGSTREYISRLMARTEPPKRMLKGFDEMLATALETSRQILFHDWNKMSPSGAGVAWELPASRNPWEAQGWAAIEPDAKLRVLLYHIGTGDDFQRWVDYAITLIDARETRGAREVEIRMGPRTN